MEINHFCFKQYHPFLKLFFKNKQNLVSKIGGAHIIWMCDFFPPRFTYVTKALFPWQLLIISNSLTGVEMHVHLPSAGWSFVGLSLGRSDVATAVNSPGHLLCGLGPADSGSVILSSPHLQWLLSLGRMRRSDVLFRDEYPQ